jgi:hypothetical protein
VLVKGREEKAASVIIDARYVKIGYQELWLKNKCSTFPSTSLSIPIRAVL